MQKETLQLSIILTSHAKQFYHLKPHRKMLTRGVDAVELRRENPSRGGDLHGTLDGVAVG